MKPGELLALAREILEHPRFGMTAVWPRAVALLGRQALEEGLDSFWDQEFELMRSANRRTQTMCLDQFARDSEVSSGVKEAWSALSRACHHHPFELSPTEVELKVWLERVELLVGRLAEREPPVVGERTRI